MEHTLNGLPGKLSNCASGGAYKHSMYSNIGSKSTFVAGRVSGMSSYSIQYGYVNLKCAVFLVGGLARVLNLRRDAGAARRAP